MLCPVCPPAGFVGGLLGSYFGIHPPKETKGKVISGLVTAAFTLISVIALKIIFNVSLCVGGTFTLRNFIRVTVIVFPFGVLYAIIVNYALINLFGYAPAEQKQREDKQSTHNCCMKKE